MSGFCTISRDTNNEIQEVYAPNEKRSNLFWDIVEALNDTSKEGKEQALTIWGRAYTDNFKKTFGNWELISKAKLHRDQIKGIYKDLFDKDPQQALFELAIQTSRKMNSFEAITAMEIYGEDLVMIAKELYPNVKLGDVYKAPLSNPIDENGEPLAVNVMTAAEKLKRVAAPNNTSSIPPGDDPVDHYGSTKTIKFFEDQSQGVNLVETEDVSYYTNGSIDPVTNTLRRFTRLTEYTYGQFIENDDSKNKFDPEKWLERETAKVFAKANAELTDKIPYGKSETPLSFDEIKAEIKKSFEESRIRGKIIHKMIEGYLKFRNVNHFQSDIDKLRENSNVTEYDLLWFNEEKVKLMMEQLGINSEDFNNTDIAFRDNIASELMMISESLGIGTSNDGFIEHSDGTVSFVDYKTGSKFLADENSIRKMLYNDGLVSPIFNSKLNKAKLELVMRMVIAKMNKPDLAVRDLKIAYLSRYYGNQIRNVDVQKYLDYINNNFKITIKELQKEVKSLGRPAHHIRLDMNESEKQTLLTKAEQRLQQKMVEYDAMQKAKVFDFYNYQAGNKLFEQDEDLKTITDPQEKIKWLKDKIARKTRASLIVDKEVNRSTLKAVKSAVIAVLNNYKSVDVDSVDKADKEDISMFASRTLGLRDQKNVFLQSFSLLFETATDKLIRKTNELLGEQSAFRKADRELYKEYYQRTGRTQARGARTFSYSQGNTPVPVSEQGVFDFMYTWKNIAGENKRVGATYTQADVTSGKISQTQFNYYTESKKIIKDLYEGVRTKIAYVRTDGKAVTYGEEYKKNDGYNFNPFQESFLPTIPFQNAEEILEKNLVTNNLNPVKFVKEYFDNYTDRYDLAVQNEDRFNIGVPLKYMTSEFMENDEHSYNVTQAVDIFSRHMLHKLEMDDVYDIGESTVALMSDIKDPNNVDKRGKLRLSNSVFALQNHLDQHILGRRRMTTQYTNNVKTNKRIDLVFDNIGGYISKNAFWFAPVTAAANGLYGVFTNGKEALIGSLSKRLFGDVHAITMTNMSKAAKISGVHQGVNLTKNSNIKRQLNEDFEGSYYKDKVNFMSKMFRLSNKNYNYTDASLMLGVHNRIFTGDNAYVAQGLGEDFSNETLVIAAMLSRKVEVKSLENGVEVTKYLKKDGSYTTDPNEDGLENMWDLYKLNDQTGEYEYTGPTRFLDKDGQEVKGMTTLETLRIKTYLERIYGAYSPEQKTWLERYAMGRMIMKFRKFQIMNIKENFTLNSHQKYVGDYVQLFNPDGSPKLKDGQPLYDWQSEAMRSRLLVVASLAGSWMNLKGSKSWKEMSIEEKKQATRFALQLTFYGLTIAIGLGALIPPEDRDKLYAKRLVRLADDLAIISPTTLLKGTTTFDSYPEQLYKFATATSTFINSVVTDDIVQSGPYQGDYKGWNTLEDFIPVYHALNQANKLVTGQ